jgi:hypothetical protein
MEEYEINLVKTNRLKHYRRPDCVSITYLILTIKKHYLMCTLFETFVSGRSSIST